MRLKTKLLFATATIFFLHFLLVGLMEHRQIKQEVIENIQEHARTIRGMLMSLRKVYQQQFLEHDIPINEQTLGLLPAHSVSRISAEFREWVSSGLTFNNVSDVPRNPDNAADAIELEAIRFFTEHEDEKERLVPFANEKGEPYYHFSQPIWVQPSCLKCHGDSADAPAGVRERYATAYDYEIGELRGIMSIKLPSSLINERVSGQLIQHGITHLVGFLAAFLLLSLFFSKTVLQPIARLQKATVRLAQGDYSARAFQPGNDEISDVSRSFDRMAEEIAQREQSLNAQKALYSALFQTNKTIIRLNTPEQLYESVCRIAVKYGGLRFAWIGRLSEGQSKIEVAASAGDSNCSLDGGFSIGIESQYGNSPIAVAVRDKCSVVVDDFQKDPGTVPWHELAIQADIHSAAIFPIFEAEHVVGTFNLYALENHFFNADIRNLLEEMTSDIAFATLNYRRNEEHREGHQRLEESSRQLAKLNNQMRLLLESTGEGIYGVDTQGCCSFINQAAVEMFGYTREEMLGQSMHKLTHHSREDGASYPIEACAVYLAFTSGEPQQKKDEVFWRKDNSHFPVDYSAYPIHEQGVVTGAVTVFRDVSESRALSQKMNFLATHDPLTRLLNRYAFERRLKEVFEEAGQNRTEHALCYMDLDQFKVVNDTCGHVAGDSMLQMLAQLLQATLRQSDTLARLGGDEFGLLLEACSLDQAYLLARKVCEEVKEFRFHWEGKSFSTGMSIGIVAIGPESESTHSALSAADAACYVAKDMGRNRVHVYRAYDEEIARRQGEMQWVSEIQAAMREQRFSLYYQPIKHLAESATAGDHFEVLLRMTNSRGRQILPGTFIPAAERYDLMVELDRWVISTTFNWLSRNRERLDRAGMCSINISGQSLGAGNLHEFIIEERRRNSIPAGKICFEVTETAAVSRLDQAIHLISLLKKLGFLFALDDFGTGMSSFAYLKSLPVDFLKIDGGFVKDILVDPVDYAMVESINQVGHLMGLQTIAEYVENTAILEKLREIGVDYAQGYGIARPVPIETDIIL